ncbi:response regulator [Bacteriovorax sp. Seq25_V]|uniref:response regulator n=1 Tax=Bacteriovorax sp. Seq25_V TaxID=1201288 RepID=UPI00038A49E1|nr:response regulator [Bacteriovorax sp. Seq25_V]EQC46252.1 response regulator receiver domain protein [Bacteriovorax sp. Seq25_V]
MMSFTRPYRIVLIDDDPEMLNLMWKQLSSVSEADISISAFSNPDEAMSFIRSHLVHIVITDIHLEFTSGADVISNCINLQRGLQIIGVTADTSIMTAIECFNRGAKYLLTKPLPKGQLIKIVSKCISFLNDWHEILADRLHSDEVEVEMEKKVS